MGAPNGPGLRRPFNRWFRYPAGFAKDLAEPLLSCLEGGTTRTVLDPFAGMATLAPWLSLSGQTFVGLEAHPLVAEFADLKAGEWINPEVLEAGAQDALARMPASARVDDEHEMVRRCFSDEALSDLVGLRTALQGTEPSVRDWLQLALVASLRDVSSSHVGWPYQRPGKTAQPRYNNAMVRFSERVRWMASDIRGALQERPHRTPGRVVGGDARCLASFGALLPGSERADACITSPPYLNNYDYADATRLELFFLERADSWASMCRYARDGMVVASTQQTGQERAEAARQRLLGTSISSQIKELVDEIRQAADERERPKEYDRLILEYFSDMLQVLINVRAHLVEGATVMMAIADSALYGVHVHTPQLISELATDAGFSCDALVMHRSRGHRWKNHPQRGPADLGEYVLRLKADGEAGTCLTS